MPEVKRQCTEVVNEIISRYSRIAFEKDESNVDDDSATTRELIDSTQEEFWTWFCSEMKDNDFKKCFLDKSRDDFYGSLEAVRKEYEQRCK